MPVAVLRQPFVYDSNRSRHSLVQTTQDSLLPTPSNMTEAYNNGYTMSFSGIASPPSASPLADVLLRRPAAVDGEIGFAFHHPQSNSSHLKGLLAILATEASRDCADDAIEDEITLPKPGLIRTELASLRSPPTVSSSEHIHLPDISYVLNGATGCRTSFNASKHEDGRLCKSPNTDHMAVSLFSTDSSVYASLCEPLSLWIADYLWKVTTRGMSLSPDFVGGR